MNYHNTFMIEIRSTIYIHGNITIKQNSFHSYEVSVLQQGLRADDTRIIFDSTACIKYEMKGRQKINKYIKVDKHP